MSSQQLLVPILLSFCENYSAAVTVIMAKPASNTHHDGHQHYNYRMKFNDIQKRNSTSTCNLKQMKDKMDKQVSNEYWKRLWRDGNNEDYVAYSNETHCVIVDTNVESSQASRATAERNYRLNRVPTAEGLGLSVNPSNFTSCNMDFFPLAYYL